MSQLSLSKLKITLDKAPEPIELTEKLANLLHVSLSAVVEIKGAELAQTFYKNEFVDKPKQALAFADAIHALSLGLTKNKTIVPALAFILKEKYAKEKPEGGSKPQLEKLQKIFEKPSAAVILEYDTKWKEIIEDLRNPTNQALVEWLENQNQPPFNQMKWERALLEVMAGKLALICRTEVELS